ncbi:hypothetical protein ABZ322_40990 [Streptomyces sp. NPDC006129]|uniref:hypothetical protein n=1 Tax=Streptomyces sp. NPDC006129 TaxID=3155348 RepID=UPI0033BA07FC
MRTRTTITAIALLLAALTACGSGKSEEEIAADCQKALTTATDATKTNRPGACEGLSQEDYNDLLMSQALKDSGLVDQDGNVNPDELLNTDQ